MRSAADFAGAEAARRRSPTASMEGMDGGLALASGGSMAPARPLSAEVLRRPDHHERRCGDVLSRHQFLDQLQLEKRRTDRSKVPFSIVLFRMNRDEGGGLDSERELLHLLRVNKRETDMLGYLGDGLIAFLLPYTNEDESQVFTRNICSRSGHQPYSTVSATYPDKVFDSLIEEHRVLADAYPAFLHDSPPVNDASTFAKRSFDILASLALLIGLSPVFLATAILIKLTSPGPVIFKQKRLGRMGMPFVFYKFRSMRSDADDSIHKEYTANLIRGRLDEVNQGDDENPHFKMKADPRVTSIGRIIRKTSIDELPQLFNVLKGDMSLVGPRPPLIYEAEEYQSWHLRRVLEVRPGITGLWQVEGRNKTSFDDMVRLDLRYIRSQSFWLDIKILVKTVFAVLKCDGDA